VARDKIEIGLLAELVGWRWREQRSLGK